MYVIYIYIYCSDYIIFVVFSYIYKQGVRKQEVHTWTLGRDTQTEHFFKSIKLFRTLQFSDTEVYGFDLLTNFLTFAYLKNENCKRNVTFKCCNTGCSGGYESVHAAKSVDTMVRLLNEDIADMHMSYGAANDNARGAARLYQERFPNR